MDEVPRACAISNIQDSPPEMKGRMYVSCVRSSMTYVSETRPLLLDVWCLRERHRRTSVELRMLVGVELITTATGSGRRRWYGHVMRTG